MRDELKDVVNKRKINAVAARLSRLNKYLFAKSYFFIKVRTFEISCNMQSR